jgi:hypothetical protein
MKAATAIIQRKGITMTNYNDTLNLNQGDATNKMRSAVGADHLNKSDAHTEDSDDNFNVGSQVAAISVKKVGQAKQADTAKASIDAIANASGPRSPRNNSEGTGA